MEGLSWLVGALRRSDSLQELTHLNGIMFRGSVLKGRKDRMRLGRLLPHERVSVPFAPTAGRKLRWDGGENASNGYVLHGVKEEIEAVAL